MEHDQSKAPGIVPTTADVGLTFPIAVVSLEDATALADAELVVLISPGPDARSGVPLSVRPAVHGEAVVAWTAEAFASMVLHDDTSEDVDDLLQDYTAFVMCGYRIAEMLLDGEVPVDRGILLKGAPSVEAAVFLDSNDLRLVLHGGHDTTACGCARGRMLPISALLESLAAEEADQA